MRGPISSAAFWFAPCDVEVGSRDVAARFDTVTVHLEFDDLTAVAEEGWIAPRFGVRQPAPFVRVSGFSTPGKYRSVMRLRIEEAAK